MKVDLKLREKAFVKIGSLMFKRVLIHLLSFVSVWSVMRVSAQESSCLNTIQNLYNETGDRSTEEKTSLFDSSQIKTSQNLAEAISKGLILTREQEKLWSIYQNTFFSDPVNTTKSFEDLLYLLENYPELSKPVFREQRLSFRNKVYPFPEGLSDFTRKLTTSSSQKKMPLMRVKENLSYWSRIFLIQRGSKKQLSPEEKKLIREKTLSALEEKLGRELIAQLEEMKDYNEALILKLYHKLNEERDRLLSESLPLELISTALLNLIHTAGFSSHAVLNKLRNKEDPQIVIKGLNQILEYREHLSEELGFKSFDDFKDSLGLKTVGEEYNTEQLKSRMKKFRKEMKRLGYELAPSKEYRVRALSLIESPFRGCVGGSDCSSRNDFEQGLDPNYIYWTKTDKSFYSSGHITTVLGTARLKSSKNSKERLAAFIDKIQNISIEELMPMLSAVQKSLKEQGYLLVFPKDIGDENGLSNTYEIGGYVEEEILSKLKGNEFLKGFTPHSHEYEFSNGFTRAYSNLDLAVWDESLSEGFEMTINISPGQKHPAYILESLTSKSFIENLLKLRDSEKEEEVRVFFKQHSCLK